MFLAAVPLGIARRALDEFATLATSTIRGNAAAAIGQDAGAQGQLALAEAALAAARSLLFDAVTEVWDAACRGDEPSLPQRVRIGLAASQAVRAGTEAVDRVFRLAGSGAVFAHHPLQRCFRDIHTAGQHILFSPAGIRRSPKPASASTTGVPDLTGPLATRTSRPMGEGTARRRSPRCGLPGPESLPGG